MSVTTKKRKKINVPAVKEAVEKYNAKNGHSARTNSVLTRERGTIIPFGNRYLHTTAPLLEQPPAFEQWGIEYITPRDNRLGMYDTSVSNDEHYRNSLITTWPANEGQKQYFPKLTEAEFHALTPQKMKKQTKQKHEPSKYPYVHINSTKLPEVENWEERDARRNNPNTEKGAKKILKKHRKAQLEAAEHKSELRTKKILKTKL